MTDDQARAVIEALLKIVRGEVTADGRDEVPGPVRVSVGAMAGRRLELAIVERTDGPAVRRLVLERGDARLVVTLSLDPRAWLPAGDARLEVPDRRAGAAFTDAIAELFGSPLDRASLPAGDLPPVPIDGAWVAVGRQRDADGVAWEALKLSAGDGDTRGDLFLRLAERRAVFSEKGSGYRHAWIAMLERAFGHARAIATRRLVGLAGGASVTVPPDWLVTARASHHRVTDPLARAGIDLSWLGVGAVPGLPPARDRLRTVLDANDLAAVEIVAIDRGDVDLASAAYERDSFDSEGGPRRLAHHRVVLAIGEGGQLLVTASAWPEDLAWFLPAWHDLVSTLRVP
ncbi:MAG TPA: hypothetical protein VHE35_31515 [Kofleriaceae bacterium]|nr:hypothetical protein [Kofleriaceae bacterium]